LQTRKFDSGPARLSYVKFTTTLQALYFTLNRTTRKPASHTRGQTQENLISRDALAVNP
jgi:hypothetical protein